MPEQDTATMGGVILLLLLTATRCARQNDGLLLRVAALVFLLENRMKALGLIAE
jgi:hypothetical protein